MKIKLKIITLSAAAALALTMSSFAAAAPFTDLLNTSAKEKILSLQEKGYVSGVGNGLFAPDTEATAVQSIQLFVNAFDLNLNFVKFAKEPKAADYFSEADNDAWYVKALIIAAVNSLELPTDLDINGHWTKEEFTFRLIKAMEKNRQLPMIKIAPPEIRDQELITVEYTGALQRALIYGVTALDSDGNFNPKVKISRAQAAEQVYNALEYLDAHSPKAVID